MKRTSFAPILSIGLVVILVVVMSLGAIGCGDTSDEPVELTVSSAASVTDAAEEIAAAFAEETDSRAVLNFGASGQLAQQIEAGAPVDVFMSANKGYVQELVDGGLVDAAEMAPYAQGTLVIWTSADQPPIGELADLASPDVTRIAIANPETAPYGKAARQALESAGILAEVESKLVIGESVEQAQQYAESGNTDVGLVALSVVPADGGHSTAVSQELYDPIIQYLGVVRTSAHLDEARAFSEFVRGPAGVAILKQHGFSEPE